jgi:hypothetical protein
MKSAAARVRDRPETKPRQDLDDITVLERLRAEPDTAAASRLVNTTRDQTATPEGASERDHREPATAAAGPPPPLTLTIKAGVGPHRQSVVRPVGGWKGR